MRRLRTVLSLLLVAAAGCTGGGGDDPSGDDDDDDDGTACPRPLAAANRVRYGAIALPYDASGAASNAWEIVALSTTGGIAYGIASFEMGRRSLGEVIFTPDGEVGLVAQDDGTIGVFTLDATGQATVVHAAFEGDFYASRLVMDPTGERAWVLDSNFPKNGGGLYSVGIGCDGALTDEGMVLPSKLFYDLELRTPGFAIAYAKSLGSSPFANDLHKYTFDPPTVTAGADAFPADDDAIVSDLALTADGNYALIADNNAFGTGNRVSVVDVVPATPVHVQTFTVDDPVSLATSPFHDVALVSSGFGDGVFRVPYDAAVVPPFGAPVELSYTGGAPQLPGNFVPVTRGDLEGLVLLAELSGIRRFRFEGSGVVTDLGLVDRGGGTENIVGAMGFPP